MLKWGSHATYLQCNGETYKDYNGDDLIVLNDAVRKALSEELDIEYKKGDYRCRFCDCDCCKERIYDFVGYLL